MTRHDKLVMKCIIEDAFMLGVHWKVSKEHTFPLALEKAIKYLTKYWIEQTENKPHTRKK